MPSLKQLLKLPLRPILKRRQLPPALRSVHPRECPICGYRGFFRYFGIPPRLDARCPCGSLERHRLFWLWFEKNRGSVAEPILHFAPEPPIEQRFRQLFKDYRTTDLFEPGTDLKLNIEAIELPPKSVGTILCNHVLEHVDDAKALAELRRILRPDGVAIVSVPIVEGWDSTYEPAGIESDALRDLHFGQSDHVRFFGKDFRDRLETAGFRFTEVTAEGPDVAKYGLIRGEKLFVCRAA